MSQQVEQKPEANTATVPTGNLMASLVKVSLGIWSFYFIAKLALYWQQLIGFHIWANLAFAAFIFFPVNHVFWRRAKQVVTVLLAVALLYYDSWLPAIGRVLSQASLLSGFSLNYLFELGGRFISLPVVAMLGIAWVMYWLASRWIRVDAIVITVMAVMAAMPIISFLQSPALRPVEEFALSEQVESSEQPAQSAQPTQPVQLTQLAAPTQPAQPIQFVRHNQSIQPVETMQLARTTQPAQNNEKAESDVAANTATDRDKILQKFFTQEAARSVSFPALRADAIPFDVIFIHVCSLSWDDLRVTGLEKHPLWHRFDIMLTHFNSASTYSGPAAIRMQRATCGQSSHASLYSPASDNCYLMDNLKRSGFEPSLALNHDGHFDKFLQTVQTQGRLNVPLMPLNGVAINQHAFDDSPIYEDLSVLDRWLENRQKSNFPRMALYYNTVSLHDGNHLTGANSKLNSSENYTIRLTKLLDDLEKFMQNIEKSGRRAVVAMIPEHGAALRGDKMQIAGLREIPSPAITLVPVGIKVIGGNIQREGDTLSIDKPTSYLAVSHIVARLMEAPPYTKKSFAPSDYVADLPFTSFVAQNDEVIMAGYKQRYYLRQDAPEWIDYTDFDTVANRF